MELLCSLMMEQYQYLPRKRCRVWLHIRCCVVPFIEQKQKQSDHSKQKIINFLSDLFCWFKLINLVSHMLLLLKEEHFSLSMELEIAIF